MFSVGVSGLGSTQGNMMAFTGGGMNASVMGTKKSCEKIVKKVKRNLDRKGSTGKLQQGVGIRKAPGGRKGYMVYVVPVMDPSGAYIPYYAEFGRPALEPINADYLWFRQLGIKSSFSGKMEGKHFFRDALRNVTQQTVNEIKKHGGKII